MESNKKNTNYEEGEQHLRKRKFNQLANDGQPVAAETKQKQQQPPEKLSKNYCGGQQENDVLEKLHLESLSREELINLVRKQEAVKKEAEESANAKQQAKEMAIKMEDLKMALLASQQKVEELTAENMEHRKHLDSSKQAEKFSQRIVQLEQEKAEVHAELGQKMAEIIEMHMEMEKKSEEVAEKAKQIDALLIQLNESTRQHQIGLQTEEEMKIQLSLETWFDMLAFVPCHRLGKIVPMIGDRKFASIIQKFLHEYGEITINWIEIVAPYKEDSSGPHPRVRARQNHSWLRFEMAEAQMPANIINFHIFFLRYFDQSVLNFMQKFQQNGLLDNVNLSCSSSLSKDILQPVLCQILPLIKNIVSIDVMDSAQLVDIYDAGNSKEIHEMNMKMMEKTRFLVVSNEYDRKNLRADKIDLYCRWLYQTARADGKPRVLVLERGDADSTPIFLFIERIKKDFQMATDPVTFFIRIILPEDFQLQEAICLDNYKQKERLLTKMEKVKVPIPDEEDWQEIVLLISRYPQASTKKLIEENEKEVLNWEFGADKTIYINEELKVVAI